MITDENVKHAMKSPVRKVSRRKLVELIENSKGRFVTTSHIDKKGEVRTMNVIRTTKPADKFGYIQVYSLKDKGLRTINPQTLLSVCSEHIHFKV